MPQVTRIIGIRVHVNERKDRLCSRKDTTKMKKKKTASRTFATRLKTKVEGLGSRHVAAEVVGAVAQGLRHDLLGHGRRSRTR